MSPHQVGFLGWFSGNPWIAWAMAALVMGMSEMLTGDLVLLMLAGGAAAGGLTAVVAPELVWLQAVVASLTAVATLGLVRPSLLKRFREVPGYRSSLQQLVGSEGRATTRITHDEGEARVNGEIWSARTFSAGMVVEVGELVEVYEVDGTHVVVYPVLDELG